MYGDRIVGCAMTPARHSLALIALATFAVGLAWAGPSSAQPSGCYQGCQLPTTSMAVSRYVVCLGVRDGGTCTVCPSEQAGQAFQIASGKSLSCFKGCAKGYEWNSASQQCCPAPTRVPSRMWWKFTDGDLRRLEVRGLSGEVNELGWPFRQRFPAIYLAHRDLPGSK